MATRSLITAKLSDGRFGSIYCHFDGYLSHNGQILLEHYNDQVKVDALIALGDLSVLGESVECPAGHSFGKAVKGYCVAYGRDRGEEESEAGYGPTVEIAIKEGRYGAQEYNYLWDGTEWFVNGLPLADAIKAEASGE